MVWLAELFGDSSCCLIRNTDFDFKVTGLNIYFYTLIGLAVLWQLLLLTVFT